MSAISKDNFFKTELSPRVGGAPAAGAARSTYEAEAAARKAKTAKLKALRLAKETVAARPR